jgi:cellulose synthase/poly-beta-1,6-N-acetylglucosamine synthase-like glycosyltransferase
MYLYLICGVIIAFYVFVLLLFRKRWSRLQQVSVPADFFPKTSFSVVIPARNEESVIAQCLTSVLAMNYPASLYEVIVVDDFSEDKTPEIAKQNGVRLISLKDVLDQQINAYKKKAVETGIRSASGEYIVVTDADCIVPSEWLRTLAWVIETEKPVMIASPVKMQSGASSLLSVFQSLDFLSLQGITAAAAGSGVMSLCNGANLCYRKKSFEEVDGFSGIDQLASGDDLLLMQKFAQAFPGRIKYCLSENVVVQTSPEKNLKAFLRQRIRWASKAMVYREKKIIVTLSLVYLTNLLPFLLFFTLFFSALYGYLLLAFILMKTMAELYFLMPVASFFKQEKQLRYFIFMQPLHIIYTVVAGLFGQAGSYTWKGRKVK